MSKKNDREERRTFFRGTVLALVLALLIGGGTWWFFAYTKDDGLIYPNVSAFGVDLGGKTRRKPPRFCTSTPTTPIPPRI